MTYNLNDDSVINIVPMGENNMAVAQTPDGNRFYGTPSKKSNDELVADMIQQLQDNGYNATDVVSNSSNVTDQYQQTNSNIASTVPTSGDTNGLDQLYRNPIDTLDTTSIVDKAPRSLVNRYALFTWMGMQGTPGSKIYEKYIDKAETADNAISPKESKVLSEQKIIEYFSEKFGGIEYDWSDFLWCKYYKKIPNNQLITLRRFPNPCEDNIYELMKDTIDDNGNDKGPINVIQPDIARAVTWMGEETGNKLEEILNFTYGYNWREQVAEVQNHENPDSGYTAQPFYDGMGPVGKLIIDQLKGITPAEKMRRERISGHDPIRDTYENFVLGPVNVINKMQTRDRGLNFENDLKITFEYKLRSYSGINPKMAFLDVFANMMTLTSSNANFWGGANRFYGGHGYVASRFGDIKAITNGNFRGYLKSVTKDFSGRLSSLFKVPKKEVDEDGNETTTMVTSKEKIKSSLSQFMDNLTNSALYGKILQKFGAAPAYLASKALLTGEATGKWHLTVGNPMNPIAMMGNLIVTDTQMNWGGALGYDDFPSDLKFEISLKHARPRDKSDIESIFNAGKGRLYAAAKDVGDILNIAGKPIEVYGAIPLRNSNGLGSNNKSVDLTNTSLPSDDQSSGTFAAVLNDGKRIKNKISSMTSSAFNNTSLANGSVNSSSLASNSTTGTNGFGNQNTVNNIRANGSSQNNTYGDLFKDYNPSENLASALDSVNDRTSDALSALRDVGSQTPEVAEKVASASKDGIKRLSKWTESASNGIIEAAEATGLM